MAIQTDYHNNKHHLRHHVIPERNEGLDIGLTGQRFATGRFRALIADTISGLVVTLTTLTASIVTISTSLTLSFLTAGYVKTDSGGAISVQATPIPNTDLGTGGSATTVLHGNQTFAQVGLTTDVTGVLPVANGGTNANSAAGARTSLGTAPLDPSYLTLGTNAELSNERVLTAGTGISFADGGAGSTLTINATASAGFMPIANQVFGG